MDTDAQFSQLTTELRDFRNIVTTELNSLRSDMTTELNSLRSDMTEVKESLAEIRGTLPHLATKAEVEEAKHEATKGKYGVLVGVIALLLSLGTLATRFIGE